MEHILKEKEKEIKEKYNLDDAGFKKAVMNLVAQEVMERYNASTAKPENISTEVAKKIIKDFKKEWQETKKAFGWK